MAWHRSGKVALGICLSLAFFMLASSGLAMQNSTYSSAYGDWGSPTYMKDNDINTAANITTPQSGGLKFGYAEYQLNLLYPALSYAATINIWNMTTVGATNVVEIYCLNFSNATYYYRSLGLYAAGEVNTNLQFDIPAGCLNDTGNVTLKHEVSDSGSTSNKFFIGEEWINYTSLYTSPNYTLAGAFPSNGSEYNPDAAYLFNITWDWIQSASNVTFKSNFTGTFANSTVTNSGNVTTISFSQSNFTGTGNYQYWWYAVNDTHTYTETIHYNYTINKNTSTVAHLALNGTEGDYTGSYPIGSNATAWKAVSDGALTLLRNGTNVNNPENASFGAGTYNYTANFTHQNYTSAQIDRLLTINKASSSITFEINGTSDDVTLADGNIKLKATLGAPSAGTVGIYAGDRQVSSGASPLTSEESGWAIGTYIMKGNWSGNANYTSDSVSYSAEIGGINVTAIRNNQDGTIISANVTVYDGSHSFTAYNVMNLSNYSSSLWDSITTIKLASAGYANRYYSTTQPEAYSFTAYMIPLGEGAYIRFHVLSIAGAAIPDATILAEQFIGSSWATVEEKITDDSGTARLFLDPLTEYRITVSASGYGTKSASITPTDTDYSFYLSGGFANTTINLLFGDTNYQFSPSDPSLVLYSIYTMNFTMENTNASLEWFSMGVSYNGTNVYFSNTTGSPSGGSITYTFNVTNISGSYTADIRFKKMGWEEWNDTRYFTIRYYPESGASIWSVLTWLRDSGMPLAELQFIAMFISFLAAGMISKMGMPGGGLVALSVLVMFAIVSWFSWTFILMISMTLLAVYTLGGGI